MLEIGCGEGRDSKCLLNKNYNLLATDVSKEAISYCKSVDLVHKECYKVLDVLSNNSLNEKFGFIYSVACLHMLVLDEDRNNFYQYIYNHLEEGGYCLILTMGDGVKQYESDISKAFDLPGTPIKSLYVGLNVSKSNSTAAFSTPSLVRA